MKDILFISTGGTIAAAEGENGLAPALTAEQLLDYVPDIRKRSNVTALQLMSIDSTNMNPSLIAKIAETISDNYDRYDAFVVTHGTDTMGYTAAALTYILRHIKKPVVVTGSQVAIGFTYTDAKENISDAIIFSLEDVAGVYVAFDGKIINGTRAVKVLTRSMNAFESVNFPNIAEVKAGRVIYNRELERNEKSSVDELFQFCPNLCPEILLLKMIPGMNPGIFDYIRDNYRGLIIESFGIGGIPNREPNLVEKIHQLIEAGLSVVVTTQCMQEGIDLGIYEVGRTLAANRIISAMDMNTEAIVAKLWWALGNFKDPGDIKTFMETPFCNDINLR